MQILLLSPRNSIAGHLSLLKSTACQKVLYGPALQSQIHQLVSTSAAPPMAIQVPDMKSLLGPLDGKPGHEVITATKTPREDDAVMILHSSGTTGLAKPIYITAGALAVIDAIKEMPAPLGRRHVHDELYTSDLMISMLPSFHIMGIATFLRSIYHRGRLAFLPTGKPVTADLMVDAITRMKPSAIACAPSILEDMSRTKEGMEALASVDHVFYGGAPLARCSGDRISRVTSLLNGFGSTEILNVPSYVPQDPADWEYLEWSKGYGVAMEEMQDGFFELVVKHKFSRAHQLVFYNFPDVSEWRTNDLFERHPNKPGLWRYAGRADDTIVFTNGEKINPVLFEKAVEGHELVRGALLVGSKRFHTALLVEPRDPDQPSPGALIDLVWPSIEAANADLPSYARVWRSMVLLSGADKPFKRTAKGSTMRKATLELYEEEIDRLYGAKPDTLVIDMPTDIQGLKRIVRHVVHSSLQTLVADDVNFFLSGMDSLKVLHITKLLQTSFGMTIAPPTVYKNPTINSLVNSIFGNTHGQDINIPSTISREQRMSAMIHNYTRSLQHRLHNPSTTNGTATSPLPPPSNKSHIVALTGSTGSLGTYLLHSLLSSPHISKIYCLNRAHSTSSPLPRQISALQSRGLPSDLDPSKVEFLTINPCEPNLALPEAQYQLLQSSLTLVIHNAWPINFNTPLEYFEDTGAITGTRSLVDLILSSPRQTHIKMVFVSSIASVGNFAEVRHGEPEIPEEWDGDNSLPLAQGYGESKHVGGSIVARAVEVGGLRGVVVRVGQLCGPNMKAAVGNGGGWNKDGELFFFFGADLK